MADDEELEVDVERGLAQPERPKRRVHLFECGSAKARAEEIIEKAQVVLDSMSAGYCYKDVAAALKAKLDESYGGTWHAIVGSHFGGNVTSDEKTLVNFKIDEAYFLVLRSGPPERQIASSVEVS